MASDSIHRYRQFAAGLDVDIPCAPLYQLKLDIQRIKADSQLARSSRLSLTEFVRLYRNQTASDPRPNKDLFELPRQADPNLQHLVGRWNSVVQNGVEPIWNSDKPQLQLTRPQNHKSIDNYLPQVRENLAKGQRDGRYLIVEVDLLDEWRHVFISPIGVVEKIGELTSIRVISDYSFPDGASVNDFSNRVDSPEISYNPPKDIARRILELRIRFPCHPILIFMLGDVSGAFRHIPVSAQHEHMFAFRFEGLLIIDLSCGFGWCGSPAYYSLAGSLINYLYQQQRPQPALAPLDSSSFVGNV
ncbi:hypothetical protein F441_13158 [Phytophthora nicotianae CJ01A1]|uniref:Reverse transcriptase domain-containing protein n=2 Tax=Phytophthora nicotianae TaxID=4792 RepID=W2WME3_PHYNI|nr:hypothetical protein L916_12800 [Phytophthora nicotianae]ETP11313.1 hypothetical protein F441_13158 [Phytophthora nicotianae CJ01A1]